MIGVAGGGASAPASEARPWLCRDKPSFSYDKPMVYEASSTGGRRWQIFLMQFEPEAAHDGFGILGSHTLATPASGDLAPGRYFAVAMRLAANGHWICAPHARTSISAEAGAIESLCFVEDESGSCRVTLAVREAGGSGPLSASSPAATPAR